MKSSIFLKNSITKLSNAKSTHLEAPQYNSSLSLARFLFFFCPWVEMITVIKSSHWVLIKNTFSVEIKKKRKRKKTALANFIWQPGVNWKIGQKKKVVIIRNQKFAGNQDASAGSGKKKPRWFMWGEKILVVEDKTTLSALAWCRDRRSPRQPAANPSHLIRNLTHPTPSFTPPPRLRDPSPLHTAADAIIHHRVQGWGGGGVEGAL